MGSHTGDKQIICTVGAYWGFPHDINPMISPPSSYLYALLSRGTLDRYEVTLGEGINIIHTQSYIHRISTKVGVHNEPPHIPGMTLVPAAAKTLFT